MNNSIGQVLSLAIRTGIGKPMKEVASVEANASAGLNGDNPVEPDRGITLLSSAQWATVNEELKTDLPWTTRRANVLVECETLAHLIGHSIQIGDVRIEVKGETDPCGVMEQQQAGLIAALAPELRGGVHGLITKGGTIEVGAEVTADLS